MTAPEKKRVLRTMVVVDMTDRATAIRSLDQAIDAARLRLLRRYHHLPEQERTHAT